jgi:hypothetical protein
MVQRLCRREPIMSSNSLIDFAKSIVFLIIMQSSSLLSVVALLAKFSVEVEIDALRFSHLQHYRLLHTYGKNLFISCFDFD